jgi:hypothetical protein
MAACEFGCASGQVDSPTGSCIGSAAPIFFAMNLQPVVTVAKQHISELFAADAPRDIRLETFLYDDHLMVWTLTIGFARAEDEQNARISKVVRVSEANRSVLSVRDP